MKNILSKASGLKFDLPVWSVPIALLVLCGIGFGLLAPALGFFWDDWPEIYLVKTQGDFLQYYQSDRPFSAWMDILPSRLLGLDPLRWHIFFIVLLWLTAVLMWWTLVMVWPKHMHQATWAAVLFVVYPAFTQQSIAVTYIRAFFPYALSFASLAAMAASVRYRRWFWPLTVFSLAAQLSNLLTSEYYAGLELARPLLLWIIFSEEIPKLGKRALRTLIRWTPYLIVLVVYVPWRLVYSAAADTRLTPALLISFAEQPLSASVHLLVMALQDLIYTFAASWYQTLQPELIDPRSPFTMLAWGLVILAGLFVILYCARLDNAQSRKGAEPPSRWGRQAVFVGLAASFAGMLPFWIIERQAAAGMYADRAALPAMFGAAIFLAGLLDYFGRAHMQKIILLGALAGLAVGFHARVQNDYRWDWTLQRRLYWQLYWRAPAVAPATVFFSERSILPKTAGYPLAMAINTLYAASPAGTELPYWALELDDMPASIPNLLGGATIVRRLRSYSFEASSFDSLPILFDPVSGRCLWVLGPEDAASPDVPPLIASILPVANLDRIEAVPASPGYPDAAIFGPEPPHTWCYYFEKAELARQSEDWAAIIELSAQVESSGYHPEYLYEWRPFIEAYAHAGQWDKVQRLILEIDRAAYQRNSDVRPALCALWGRLVEGTAPAPARESAASAIAQTMECPAH